jgi:hypothetical protein
MIKLIVITQVTKENVAQVTEKMEREFPYLRWGDNGKKPSTYSPRGKKYYPRGKTRVSLIIDLTINELSFLTDYRYRKRDIVFDADAYLNKIHNIGNIPISEFITNLSPCL